MSPLRDDLLELQRRLTVTPPSAAPVTQFEKIAPGKMPDLPEFLVRKRTPETDERCRRYVEQDQKRPLVGGIAGLFRAHDENERRRQLGEG
jgi:hypothetical protein